MQCVARPVSRCGGQCSCWLPVCGRRLSRSGLESLMQGGGNVNPPMDHRSFSFGGCVTHFTVSSKVFFLHWIFPTELSGRTRLLGCDGVYSTISSNTQGTTDSIKVCFIVVLFGSNIFKRKENGTCITNSYYSILSPLDIMKTVN